MKSILFFFFFLFCFVMNFMFQNRFGNYSHSIEKAETKTFEPLHFWLLCLVALACCLPPFLKVREAFFQCESRSDPKLAAVSPKTFCHLLLVLHTAGSLPRSAGFGSLDGIAHSTLCFQRKMVKYSFKTDISRLWNGMHGELLWAKGADKKRTPNITEENQTLRGVSIH